MDSLIPWSILSVLLQRLPVHRAAANPAPPAQPLPWPCPQCPQHSLNFKPCGQKPDTPGRQEVGPIPELFFHAGDWNPTKPGRQAGITRWGWAWEVQGCPGSSCGHLGDPHPLQLLTSSPSGILFLPAQGIFSSLGFKAVCVSGNFPPVSIPKARCCLQGDTKHPSPAPLTAARALEELEFTPRTRTCSIS